MAYYSILMSTLRYSSEFDCRVPISCLVPIFATPNTALKIANAMANSSIEKIFVHKDTLKEISEQEYYQLADRCKELKFLTI